MAVMTVRTTSDRRTHNVHDTEVLVPEHQPLDERSRGSRGHRISLRDRVVTSLSERLAQCGSAIQVALVGDALDGDRAAQSLLLRCWTETDVDERG